MPGTIFDPPFDITIFFTLRFRSQKEIYDSNSKYSDNQSFRHIIPVKR